MRWIAWLVLLAAAVVPTAAAQTPGPLDSLRVGTVELSLGMPQEPTLAALRRQFHVEHARGAGDDWAVIHDGQTIAVVSFSAGELSRVSKTWVTTRQDAAASLADQIYALAGELAGQGRTECTLAARPYRVGAAQGRIVTLACGNKSIQLVQSRTRPNAWVTSLQEVLQ